MEVAFAAFRLAQIITIPKSAQVEHVVIVLNAFSVLMMGTVLIVKVEPAIMKLVLVSPAARKILATQEEWSATSIPAFVSKQNVFRIVIALLTSEKNAGFTSTRTSKNTDVKLSVVKTILTVQQIIATPHFAHHVDITTIVMLINPVTTTLELVELLKRDPTVRTSL
jgi:hypothetical protein